jgi:protoheme IX farnesyltransferase
MSAAAIPRGNGSEMERGRRAFGNYVWGVLAYNIACVAWGVFVRAGKYGDGCGSHWPLCDGDHTPLMGDMARWVEMSHRVSTALIGLLVIAQLIWAMRLFPQGHLVRAASAGTLFFTLLEGAIGAALVKFGLVVMNDSAARAGVMAFHVISTFFLLSCLYVAARAADGLPAIRWKGQGVVAGILGMGLFGIGMLGVSGAISALGNQLRPTDYVLEAAMNPATFWMVRLQPTHPLIAASLGLYLVLAAGLLIHLRPDPAVRRAAYWMVGLYAAQCLLGLLNIFLKAPIPMQMAHLVLADINFISLVAVSLVAFGAHIERVEHRPAPVGTELAAPLTGRAKLNAYVALTKPRVISLLLFTTLTAMVAAAGGWPGTWLFLAVGVAGYMSAGAANAINMVIDRDIDLFMTRTARRPTVTQSISSRHALVFALTLAFASFALLWSAANLLSAMLALSGLVFYVVVYTLLLKRRTWHNIVIGGAAGAFPPLVGWAAVANELPPLALYLFAIIFVWTPVHFWALALMLKDEYAGADVPMLPVVKGEEATVRWIGFYTAVTVLFTFAPLLFPHVGWIYGLTAAVLNILLVRKYIGLVRQIDRPHASGLFHFSMLYLAILFLVLAIDRSVGWV